MKKVLTMVLVLALALLSTGVAMAASPVEATVRVGVPYDWSDLSPWGVYDDGKTSMQRSIYEKLFDIGENGLEPVIGKAYEQVDDYTFHVEIYDNVYDSEGNHFTANDVLFAYETLGPNDNDTKFIDHIEVVDDYNLNIVLNTLQVGNIDLFLTRVDMVTQAAYEASGDGMATKPVGTGPYVLTDYISGSYYHMTRRADYWQSEELCAVQSRSNITDIEYKIIAETAQVTIALATGEIDIAQDVSASQMYQFEEGGDYYGQFNVSKQEGHLMQVLFFNCAEDNAFNDVRLRQAVCYAIDLETILQGAYSGDGVTCTTHALKVYYDYLASWADLDYYTYNPEKAKELLVEAGCADGLSGLEITCDTATHHVRTAQIIQGYLAEVGINITVNSVESAMFSNAFSNRTYDMLLTNYSSDGLNSSIWSRWYDLRTRSTTRNGLDSDETLQELLYAAIDSPTSSDETLEDFREYFDSIVPIYALCAANRNIVSVNTIEEMVCDYTLWVLPGSCTYAENFGA